MADQPLAVITEGDDGRRGAHALGVLDDFRGLAFHDGATHELVVPRSMPMTLLIRAHPTPFLTRVLRDVDCVYEFDLSLNEHVSAT
jgi:hypothetical protein